MLTYSTTFALLGASFGDLCNRLALFFCARKLLLFDFLPHIHNLVLSQGNSVVKVSIWSSRSNRRKRAHAKYG